MKTERFQCNSCGAEYSDRAPDGGPYFHACAPIQTDDSGLQLASNARDENIKPVGSTGLYAIKSEGDGVKCLTNKKLTEPAWISKLKLRAAALEEPND